MRPPSGPGTRRVHARRLKVGAMPSARATFRPCLLALCALPWLAGAQAAPQATPPSADLEFAATVEIASMTGRL